MQKNQLFSKTYPSNLLKSHKKYPFGSITMSEKDGSGHPPKKFQYGDIEIFSLWRSLTGRNWHARQITPWKGQSDPETLCLDIIHDNMSCLSTLGPFRYPGGAQKGPFGPQKAHLGSGRPFWGPVQLLGLKLVPIVTECSHWVGHIHIMCSVPLTALYHTPGAPKRSKKGPLGAPGGPLTARGAWFGPKCRQLVQLGLTHSKHTLWPGIGHFCSSQAPQKALLCPKVRLLGSIEFPNDPNGVPASLMTPSTSILLFWMLYELSCTYLASILSAMTQKGPIKPIFFS